MNNKKENMASKDIELNLEEVGNEIVGGMNKTELIGNVEEGA